MIKLVVSDVDGTLLQRGEAGISKEVREMIGALKERGILFAAASGRPYVDLKHLFGDAAGDMAFLASDGAFVSYKSQRIASFPMERETGFALMREVYMETEAEVALYSPYMAYMIPKKQSFAEYFRGTVHNHVETVACMRNASGEYLKVGIYHAEDVERHAGPVAAYWNDKLNLVYRSGNWLEYTAAGVHKGTGLDKLLRTFGILPEETLAFGDNWNDREMLAMAGCSYAMSHAPGELKELCGYETASPVETVRTLLAF